MVSFGVRITEEAFGDLARLDKENRSALTGPFTGYFKLRAGDYRVLSVVDDDAEEIIVRAIGHRSAVYRDRS